MDLKVIASFLVDFGRGYLIFCLFLAVLFFIKVDGLRKSFVFYLTIMAFTEFISNYVGLTFGSNHIILPIYCLVELSFFFYLFEKYLFKKRHFVATVFGTIGLAYIAFEFSYNFIYHHVSPAEYQPYAKVVDNFVIIIFSLTYLLEKMTTYNESRWDNFSFNIGLLIYFTLSTIFYLPFNFLVNETTGLKFYFWISNVILIYAFYTFLITEMYKNAFKNRRLVQVR